VARIALADGAGGTSRAAEAANAVVAAAMTDDDDNDLLERVDAQLIAQGGQTTAVVLSLTRSSVTGASVGDSQAWLVGDAIVELTANQRRKPLVGDGCLPVAFSHGPIGTATLVVGSDGLFGYAQRRAIALLATQKNLQRAAEQLIELVRLRTGDVPDDVTLVLARLR
jgi:PPM family protein phosphatase